MATKQKMVKKENITSGRNIVAGDGELVSYLQITRN